MRFLHFPAMILLLALAPFAMADDAANLSDRMDRIERDLQTVQIEIFRGEDGKPSAASAADQANRRKVQADMVSRLDSRLSDLENSVRQLTGKLEEVQHAQSQQQQFLDKYTVDQELRLQSIEQKIQTLASPPPALPPTPEPPKADNAAQPIVPTATPADAKGAYDQALALMQQADYPAAQKSLQQWLQNFPGHALSGNAQYWLGETYYVRQMYQESAVEFLKAYKQYPKGSKAPDSLLKLGLSLSNLGSGKEACASLGKLRKEYPKASEAIVSRAAQESKKLKCAAPPA